jgi:hypothetical protein
VLTIVFSLIGSVGFLTNGFYELKRNLITSTNKELMFDRQQEYKDRDTFWSQNFYPISITDTSFESNKKNKILIIGDSVAKDFYLSTISIPKIEDFHEIRYFGLDDSCMNTLDISKSEQSCSKSVNLIKERELIKDSEIVILVAHWQRNTWRNAIRLSSEIPNKAIIIIGNLKVTEVSSIAMRAAQRDLSYEQILELSYYSLDQEMEYSQSIKEALKDNKNLTHVEYFDKKDAFCSLEKKQCHFFNFKSSKPFIWDDMHITKEGIKPFSEWIEQEVLTNAQILKVQ